MTVRRWPALVVIAGLLGVAAFVDRGEPAAVDGDPDVTVEVSEGAAMPLARPSDAASSIWYCASGTGSGNDAVQRQVLLLANTSDEDRRGTATIYGGEQLVVEEVDVPARSRVTLNATDLSEEAVTAALVELDGGGTAVAQLVDGSAGRDVAECASSAAREWYVASGTTTADASLHYAIFNPFPDAAILDMTFETDDGARIPERFQGFVVPGASVALVDIGEVVTRRGQVSASIVARAGRVVVDRIQAFGGEEETRGFAVSLAEPEPAETWFFPSGLVGEGIVERFVVYNPTEEPAEIDLAVALEDPETNGIVEPFELTVSRRGFVVLTTRSEEWQRIPEGVPFSVTVTSLNGVPVVAERTTIAREPAGTLGIATAAGTPLLAEEILLVAGDLRAALGATLGLHNPEAGDAATVQIVAVADGEERVLEELEVGGGERLTVRLNDLDEHEGAFLVLRADAPIVVEEAFRFDDPEGRGLVRGIPVIGTTRVPDPFGPGS